MITTRSSTYRKPWACVLAPVFFLAFGCTSPNPEFDPALGDEWEQITPFDPVTGELSEESISSSVDPTVEDATGPEGGNWPAEPQPDPGDPGDQDPDNTAEKQDPEGEPDDEDDPVVDPAPDPDGFGELCTAECPGDQLCVYTASNAAQGICLSQCTNVDQPCNVPDPSYYSGCAKYFNPDLGKVKLCAIFCYLHGQTFPCPNQTDYKCKMYGPALGICVPE